MERKYLALIAAAVLVLTGCVPSPGESAPAPATKKSPVTVTPTPTPSPSPSPSPSPTPTPTAAAHLVAELASVTFPKARDNDPIRVLVYNDSTVATYALRVSQRNSEPAFTVAGDCDGRGLAPDEFCTMTVDFANPYDTARSDVLNISYEDPRGRRATLAISLQGPGRALSATPQVQKSARSCGPRVLTDVCSYATPSVFDGASCFVGWAPGTRVAYYEGGNFLYASAAGTPCAGSDWFNGSKCVFLASPQGYQPFVYQDPSTGQWGYYFKPSSRTVATFYQAECPSGSIYDGTHCVVGNAPRATATVDIVEDRYGTRRPMFRYPPAAGVPCVENDYYDSQKCQYLGVPEGWTAGVVSGTKLIVQPRNVTCVE